MAFTRVPESYDDPTLKKRDRTGFHKLLLVVILLLGPCLCFAYDSNARSLAKMVRDVRVSLQFTRRIHTDEIQIVPLGPGEVILSGRVPTMEEKVLSVSTAMGLGGMHGVTDHLRVSSNPIGRNLQTQEKIESKLREDPIFTPNDTVIVHVDHGAASLDGVVSSWKIHENAVRDAFAGGAQQVVSELVIRDDLSKSSHTRIYKRTPSA